jgi:hypothetical protein
MSVSTQTTFDSQHTDQIHDCQYDYYGRVRTRNSFFSNGTLLPSLDPSLEIRAHPAATA